MLPDGEKTGDGELRQSVFQALAKDPRMADLDLRIGVLYGVVHLAGTAPSREMWEEVEHTVTTVPGVRGVANRIQAPGAPDPSRTIHLVLKPIADQGDKT